MTVGRLGTSGAGMVFVETKAMGPTVKDLGAVIGSGHAGCGNGSRGGAGVGAEPAGNMAAALALWNPAWLVVRHQRRSLFAAVKADWNLVYVRLAVARVSQLSHAWANMPVDSKRRCVRSTAAVSEMGSLPSVAMRWTSWRHSHNNSIGSFGFHKEAMLARFFSRSEYVNVP